MTIQYRKLFTITVAILLSFLLANCTAKNTATISTESPQPSQIPTATATTIPASPTPEPTLTPEKQENPEIKNLIETIDKGEIADIAISPNKNMFAVYVGKGIYIYDIETFSEIAHMDFDKIKFYRDEMTTENALGFAPNGDILYFSTFTDIRKWNLNDDEVRIITNSKIPQWHISNIESSPDGTRLIVTTEGYMNGYESGSGINYAIYTTDGMLLYNKYFYNDESESFYHITNDGKIIFMQTYSLYDRRPEYFPFESEVVDLITGFLFVSSYKKLNFDDGTFVETVNGNAAYLPSKTILDQWRADYHESTNLLYEDVTCQNFGGDWGLRYNIFNRQNNIALVAALDDIEIINVEQWNISECKRIQNLPISNIEYYYTIDDENLLFVNKSFSVDVWELETMSNLYTVQNDQSIYPIVIRITGDYTRIITSTEYFDPDKNAELSNITIRELSTGKELLQISPGYKIRYIQITENPDVLLTRGIQYGCGLWDIETGKQISELPFGDILMDDKRNGVWIVEEKDPETLSHMFSLYDYDNGNLLQESPIQYGRIHDPVMRDNGNTIEYRFTTTDLTGEMLVFDINKNEIYPKEE